MTTEAILLVDSDPTFLRIVARALETAGYDIETAASGTEAMERAAATPYAVVVTALELRDIPGKDLLRDLAETLPQTECLVLTTDPDLHTLVEIYESGNVFNHLGKPLEEIGELARNIGRALERRALKRQNAYLLTELRDARDQLRNQTEFLVQVERLAALGQMAADLAEDLDAPLAGLAGYAEYLHQVFTGRRAYARSEDQQAQVADYLQEMAVVAGRCRALVIGMSGFATGAPGPMEPTDLHEVLHDTFGLLRHTLEARGIRLESAFAPELPPILARGPQLQQALTHLALNAVHAMPDGGRLYLSTEALSAQLGGARIRLRDTGIGIAPETLPYIFDPFFTTRPLGQGTGLGLSITRSILRECDAEIAVESALGQGTTFTITFPAFAAVRPEEAALVLAA